MTHTQDSVQIVNRWEAERLRATAFLLPGAETAEIRSWWTKVVGQEPEEVLDRRGVGQLQQTGIFHGKRLAFVAQPGRVDWNLLASMGASDEPPEGLLTLGSFSDALEPFQKLVLAWLDLRPSVTRLAFGAILVRPVADLNSGYKEIAPLLHSVTLDPENSSDFLYQINRPRMSTSGIDLKLNRLNRWSVMQAGFIEVAFVSDVEPTLARGPRQIAARLELDINTAAEHRTKIPEDKARFVFDELVKLGKEIAERGDTR